MSFFSHSHISFAYKSNSSDREMPHLHPLTRKDFFFSQGDSVLSVSLGTASVTESFILNVLLCPRKHISSYSLRLKYKCPVTLLKVGLPLILSHFISRILYRVEQSYYRLFFLLPISASPLSTVVDPKDIP